MQDETGDRMKLLEGQTRIVLPSGSFTVLRVDGRAFHTYTRGLQRPFDADFAADMDAVALALALEVSGAVAVYVQSDEISVIATDMTSELSQHWFGGVVQKVASVGAALATATMMQRRPGKVALFDGRAFSLSDVAEVADYLGWRQADARRNAVSMVAHEVLGKSKVHGVGTRGRIDMLAAAGVSMSDFDPGSVNGRLIFPSREVSNVEYVHKKTLQLMTIENVERTVWTCEPAPHLQLWVPGVLERFALPEAVRAAS